jgi:hypothetical protein
MFRNEVPLHKYCCIWVTSCSWYSVPCFVGTSWVYFRAYEAAEQEIGGTGTRKLGQEVGIQMSQWEMVALKRD